MLDKKKFLDIYAEMILNGFLSAPITINLFQVLDRSIFIVKWVDDLFYYTTSYNYFILIGIDVASSKYLRNVADFSLYLFQEKDPTHVRFVEIPLDKVLTWKRIEPLSTRERK